MWKYVNKQRWEDNEISFDIHSHRNNSSNRRSNSQLEEGFAENFELKLSPTGLSIYDVADSGLVRIDEEAAQEISKESLQAHPAHDAHRT